MKRIASFCVTLALVQFAHADVTVLESDGAGAKHRTQSLAGTTSGANPINAHTAKPGEKPHGIPLGGVHPNATGSQHLIDQSGLEFFINTNITFSTSSSASGAMSEASYTHAVAATTLNGGVTNSQLNDAFDGYNTICISLSGVIGTCRTNNSSFIIYEKNGPATTECNGRQIVLPTQTISQPVVTGSSQTASTSAAPAGVLTVSRKVYVPTDDTFARTMDILTNVSSSPITFSMDVANNLGSDANTKITATSAGGTTASAADTWIASFQNYSGTTSSDVRLGHVIQGAGSPTPVAGLNFVDGDDNPWWGYNLTLAPGQTKIIVNFVTGQPSNAAAAANAQRISTLPATTLECMTPTEKSAIVNFAIAAPPTSIPSLSPIALAWLMLGLIGTAVFFTVRRRAR